MSEIVAVRDLLLNASMSWGEAAMLDMPVEPTRISVQHGLLKRLIEAAETSLPPELASRAMELASRNAPDNSLDSVEPQLLYRIIKTAIPVLYPGLEHHFR